MFWREDGKDLVAIRLDSGESLLAVMCHHEGDIFPWASNPSADVNSMRWGVFTAAARWYVGRHAVLRRDRNTWPACWTLCGGSGHLSEKRMKATRIAMELTLKVFDGACVIPELRHIMVRAKTALALTCNSQKAACDETRSYDEQFHGCAADSGGQNSRVDPLKARPSQIGEVIPPMDTEVIVEWAQPSARMYAGVQQSRPWLSMQAQAVSSAIQEGRPWTPLAAFPYSIPRKVPPQGGTVNPPGEEDTVDELRTLKNMMVRANNTNFGLKLIDGLWSARSEMDIEGRFLQRGCRAGL